MNDLSTTAYFQLLTAFLKAIGQAEAVEAINKEEGIVEWTVGNLIIRLLPHHSKKREELGEPDSVIVEADLMLLDLENQKLNHGRFLILHQLNAVSRITNGIVAFITEEGMLSINKIVPLQGMDQDELASEIAVVIQAAEELYQGWNELARAQNEAEDSSEEKGWPLDQRGLA